MKKYVYSFEEGSEKLKSLLGGKGAGLSEMTGLGIQVPPGFTLTTEACAEFYRSGEKWPAGLKEEVDKKLEELERELRLEKQSVFSEHLN